MIDPDSDSAACGGERLGEGLGDGDGWDEDWGGMVDEGGAASPLQRPKPEQPGVFSSGCWDSEEELLYGEGSEDWGPDSDVDRLPVQGRCEDSRGCARVTNHNGGAVGVGRAGQRAQGKGTGRPSFIVSPVAEEWDGLGTYDDRDAYDSDWDF